MRHRIAVLGTGYAGISAAGFLARHLHAGEVELTVVNAEPGFVERIRLHQVAAGRPSRRHDLQAMLAGTGVRLRIARVTALDAARRTVALTDGTLHYDTLLYALGSGIGDRGVPGVAEHAFHVADRPAAQRLADRLAGLDAGGTVLVVGGNLTAIEVATELAEARPADHPGHQRGARRLAEPEGPPPPAARVRPVRDRRP